MNTKTSFPCSTGEAARLLNTTEPRLAETVRRGKIHPEPRIIAGRRLWEPSQLLQASKVLGLLTPDLLNLLSNSMPVATRDKIMIGARSGEQ